MDEKPISSALATLFFAVCVVIVLTVPSWSPLVSRWAERFDRWGEEPKPMPTMSIPPLPQQVRCPPWHPGLSRTVVIYVTETEGEFDPKSVNCVRMRERSLVLPKVVL